MGICPPFGEPYGVAPSNSLRVRLSMILKLLEENTSIFQINAGIKPYEGISKSFVEDEVKGFTKTENFFQK